MGAFHSTKNSGLTFRNFHMSNGTVFSTAPDRSRSIPARAHFTRQNAEGSWKSGYFKRRKPLHRNKFNTYRYAKFFLDIYLIDSNTIFAWWEQLANFSRGKVCPGSMQTERTKPRKFGTISPQFSNKSDPNVENRQSRTGWNCGRLFCIQCSVVSKDSLPSCSWGRFIPGRNAKWNRKFPEFPNFQKKGQPREVDRNFRNDFPETVCSIGVWTGISGNFGRMERARYFTIIYRSGGE